MVRFQQTMDETTQFSNKSNKDVIQRPGFMNLSVIFFSSVFLTVSPRVLKKSCPNQIIQSYEDTDAVRFLKNISNESISSPASDLRNCNEQELNKYLFRNLSRISKSEYRRSTIIFAKVNYRISRRCNTVRYTSEYLYRK